jgi:hypothetical protein
VSRFEEMNRQLIIEAGAVLNLNKETASRLIESLRSRMVQVAADLYVEYQIIF